MHVAVPDSPGEGLHTAVLRGRDGDGAPGIAVSRDGAVWWASMAGGVVEIAAKGTLAWTGDPRSDPALLGGDFDGDGAGDVAVAGSIAYEDRLAAAAVFVSWSE